MVTKTSMRATLVQMDKGQEEVIPMGLYSSNSVRNCASVLGTDMNRQYKVAVDREAHVCRVTRVS